VFARAGIFAEHLEALACGTVECPQDDAVGVGVAIVGLDKSKPTAFRQKELFIEISPEACAARIGHALVIVARGRGAR
jgi:hypothetical protein